MGDGKADKALFNYPKSVAVDAGDNVFVADTKNHCIRRISKDGEVMHVAGNGKKAVADGRQTECSFNNPKKICVDNGGNVYVADTKNNCIRKITRHETVNKVTTIAGNHRNCGAHH